MRDKSSLTTRRRVEDEEANLVLGDMDRAVEADARLPLRQLFRRRACRPLPPAKRTRVAAGKERLDEVTRHVLDATAPARRWKRQNV